MSKCVLVCDDSDYMRSTISTILTDGGFTVVEATNGLEAVEKYKELSPVAALLDITMPKKDGFEALNDIKEFDPDAKVIIFSAMGQKNIIDKAYEEGAVDFIIKPFQSNRVLAAVRKIVE